MFKIIEDKNNYKFVDSVTEELWENYAKTGFSIERIKKRLVELNKRPDLYWKGKYIKELSIKKRELSRGSDEKDLQEEISNLESILREL